jgi:hypothetical protein
MKYSAVASHVTAVCNSNSRWCEHWRLLQEQGAATATAAGAAAEAAAAVAAVTAVAAAGLAVILQAHCQTPVCAQS